MTIIILVKPFFWFYPAKTGKQFQVLSFSSTATQVSLPPSLSYPHPSAKTELSYSTSYIQWLILVQFLLPFPAVVWSSALSFSCSFRPTYVAKGGFTKSLVPKISSKPLKCAQNLGDLPVFLLLFFETLYASFKLLNFVLICFNNQLIILGLPNSLIFFLIRIHTLCCFENSSSL